MGFTYSNNDEKKRLCSISFVCSSSSGLTNFGPYGTAGEVSDPADGKCPDNHHVSYIRGEAGKFVNHIDVVCVRSGQSAYKTEQESLTGLNVKEHINVSNTIDKYVTEEPFDDSCFAKGGRRPIKVKVFTDTYVTAVQITYGPVPVAVDCKLTHIELIGDNTKPEIVDYELLGIAVGSTCSSLAQQLSLSVQDSRSHSVLFRHSTTNSKFNNVAGGLTFIGGFWGKWTSLGYELFGGVTFDNPITNAWESAYTEANITGVDKSAKAAINYQGPGAGVLVGFRTRYSIRNSRADVLYRYTCRGGSTPPIQGSMPIIGNVYGNVFFQDFHFPFGSRECNAELRACISRLKLNNFIYRPKNTRKAYKQLVDKCFLKN